MNKITAADWKKNKLKAIQFDRPDFIPMNFHINESCFDAYDEDALMELMEQHPFLFRDFHRRKKGERHYDLNARKDEPYTDDFGCVWKTSTDGITGTVVEHPIKDWETYANYRFPDPETSNGLHAIDWTKIEEGYRINRENGALCEGGLRHGHTFLQLCDLRGYENLLLDMMDEEPMLWDLVHKLEEFNLAQIRHLLKAGADIVAIPEDLGMQSGPMLSVESFLKYIQPSYRRFAQEVRNAGKLIHMHSDGDIRLLAEHIVEGGVEILNLQDLVNGIDWISQQFKGKICIDLDIDRQLITPFGTPEQIDALVREEVEKIGSKEGGLTMIYGLYPGVPLENVKAIMDAMERYAFYYS